MQTHESAAPRALSLDGGGVRGLSSLLILENLMHQISPEKHIRPCNVFGLIGGTSTGGIIAIMLGRLGMSVKDCITAYHSLSRDIFDGPWRPKAWQTSKKVLGLTGDAELRSRRLEEVICRIIEQYLPAEEKSALFGNQEFDPRRVPLLNPGTSQETPICRVFVVAAQQSNGRRVILRNYPVPYEAPHDMTLVEACLATSAAPFVFAPLTAGPDGCRETYIDGGLGNNNPISIVLQEARLLWPRESIKSLVSVGTGARVPAEVKQNLRSLAKKVAEMIVDAANEARDFESNIRLTEPSIHSVYFRLDVAESMARIGLAEWRMLGAIAQRTRSWIFENRDLLSKCAVTLGAIVLNCDATCYETDKRSRQPPTAPLPELSVEIMPTEGDFADQLVITDPENTSKLNIGLWRTVRLPEDGKVYNLPAGLGKFPLVEAGPFREKLAANGIHDADLVIPMYDREAMYLELGLDKFDFSNPQRPFAIRPYIGGINAITGESIKTDAGVAETVRDAAQKRVGSPDVNEVLGWKPRANQDYIITDISIHDINVHPQWLDGIAVAPGRVKQFVCVPFGSGKSVEAQKRGEEIFGGIQLEIIPSLPLSHLRQPATKDIKLNIHSLSGQRFTIWIDQRALVWDLLLIIRNEHVLGGPLDFNRLIFAGRGLEPLGTLDSYGIENESIIHLVPKLRGGGVQTPQGSKRMAIGAGGAISQNIKADLQPPWIWDYSRAKLINIQIVNSVYFEELTGIVAPTTPIDFKRYLELGIPFYRYYLEDAEALSGNFDNIQSVGSSTEVSDPGDTSDSSGGYWNQSPDSCSKCNENAPYRL